MIGRIRDIFGFNMGDDSKPLIILSFVMILLIYMPGGILIVPSDNIFMTIMWLISLAYLGTVLVNMAQVYYKYKITKEIVDIGGNQK